MSLRSFFIGKKSLLKFQRTIDNLVFGLAIVGFLLIFTDVGRDGTGQGLNIAQTLEVAEACPGVPVIASGGLASTDEIRACMSTTAIDGAIIGRALYDGRITPAAALAVARER